MKEVVAQGLLITVVGMGVVFASLLLLAIVFKSIPKILQFITKKRLQSEGKIVNHNDDLDISVEVNAAIGAAIYLYFSELHDDESQEMTIRKITKTYSPWSSKIYSVNVFNNK